MQLKRVLPILATATTLLASCTWIEDAIGQDPFLPIYEDSCASCHGSNMEGSGQGPALIGAPLQRGETVPDLVESIKRDIPGHDNVKTGHVKPMAILIAERRQGLWIDTETSMNQLLSVPDSPITKELATFRLETVATGIDRFAFSIAPLANGDILVTEKMRGLSIISPDGSKSALIEGTPPVSDAGRVRWGLHWGVGWLLDVAPHPDYADNGWIYLHHTEFRKKLAGLALASFNRLVRGRIRDGKWLDEQILWNVSDEFYNVNGDIGAGGRLAFDGDGHLYLSTGAKTEEWQEVQKLSTPYGKIIRLNDDGSIPDDNPFLDVPDAMPGIWSYGHRNPQGLEYDAISGKLWSTEFGPRGGDEINLIEAGKNYGWPLASNGLHYDGKPVTHWNSVGVAFDEIEQPIVDFTPAPAISSFAVYNGDAFPAWKGQLLVGTLKASRLYRVHIKNGQHVSTEILIDGLARIRDVEVGADGLVYLLLEHQEGSRIVRLAPI